MKVKDLIKELKKFNPEKKVTISDGYDFHFYDGEYKVTEFEGDVDIGIGATKREEGETK